MSFINDPVWYGLSEKCPFSKTRTIVDDEDSIDSAENEDDDGDVSSMMIKSFDAI